MTKIRAKTSQIRLDSESYRKLHQHVLERDGWRCQACGSMRNLQVHHLQLRSQLGSDTHENLITLCAKCHARMHQPG